MGAVVSPSALSLPLLPPWGKDSSPSVPAPAWGPSHGRQSSINCSSMGPSHGLQFFMNCPRWVPSMGCILQEQAAPAWVSHGVTAFFRYPSAPAWGPPWAAAGGYPLHHGPPWAAGAQPSSP